VYNRTAARTEEFMAGPARGKSIQATYTVEELVDALEKPHKIMLMVKAGGPVDDTIAQLKPHLEPGDLIIDGGNSFFGDTERRAKELAEVGINYIGTGVSGGEYGALWGPSIMPGGQPEAWEMVKPIFNAIAARVDGDPCVTYIGPRGSGHYVKMVHNGIEYGDMQLIAEAYDILKRIGGLPAAALGLLVLWPLLAVLAVLVRRGSPGPALFRQERAGRDMRPFIMYKFRTMRADVDPFGASPEGGDAARLTRTGRWLRETSLDELPQLWNILKGDMSLVGPRPLYMSQARAFTPRQR